MMLQRKAYKKLLAQKKRADRDALIEKRKKALELKKLKKAAVLKIEKARYAQLHRRECRLLRKYLAMLPCECRGLYFKFVDVKKRTHMLVNDFVGYMQEAHRIQVVDSVELKYLPE